MSQTPARPAGITGGVRGGVLGGVLGVDPGLRATGWGVLRVDDDGGVELAWGVIRPSTESLAERLVEIHTGISDVIERYAPRSAAVERPFLNRNIRTAVALGQAEAAAMMAAAQAGLDVAEYAPRAVRQAVVGDGAADKQAVATALVRHLQLGRLEASNDAADALAVAYCHTLMSRRLPLGTR